MKWVGILLFVSIALVSITALYALTVNNGEKTLDKVFKPLGNGNPPLDPKFAIENSTGTVAYIDDQGNLNITGKQYFGGSESFYFNGTCFIVSSSSATLEVC